MAKRKKKTTRKKRAKKATLRKIAKVAKKAKKKRAAAFNAAGAEHSEIGASGMDRWAKCPGSVRMCRTVPNHQTSFAAEGTLAHEYAALRLDFLDHFNTDKKDAATEALRKFIAGNQSFVDDAKEHIDVYIDYIDSQMGNHPKAWTELPVGAPDIDKDARGTGDRIMYHEEVKLLQVVDLKYGAGVLVEVEDNVQLLCYGLYALRTLNLDVEELELVIVQPRAEHVDGPIRKWRVSLQDVEEFEVELYGLIQATRDPKAPLVPGDQCRWCDAAAVCPVKQDEAQRFAREVAFVDSIGEDTVEPTYDKKKFAKNFAMIGSIEAWCKAVREFAYQEAANGRMLPDHKLVLKRATRKWIDEQDAKDEIQLCTGFDNAMVLVTPKLKSPAQIEKLFDDKTEAADLVAPLVKKVSTGTKLVHENAPGEPITAEDAKDVFDGEFG